MAGDIYFIDCVMDTISACINEHEIARAKDIINKFHSKSQACLEFKRLYSHALRMSCFDSYKNEFILKGHAAISRE